MSSKRIPKQSSIRGFSSKGWTRFILSLSELECDILANHFRSGYLTNIHNSPRCEKELIDQYDETIAPCSGCNILQKMIQSGYMSNVPSPRLVGIELNPGPPRDQQKKKKIITTVVVKKNQKNPPQRKKKKVSRKSTNLPSLAVDYMRTLKDPFEYGPIALGYDTFVKTNFATGYRRASLTVNADGSFGLFAQPSCGNCIMTNNAGAAVATWSTSSVVNQTYIATNMTEARVVSCGIRAFALFPLTSAPGVMCVGTSNTYTRADIGLISINSLFTLPNSEIDLGTRGCSGVMLPSDPDSYTFNLNPTISSGYGSTALTHQNAVYICGVGFPVGTVIWYEFIVNLEGLPANSSVGVGINGNEIGTGDSLATYFPTSESLFNNIRGYLGSAVELLGDPASPSNDFNPSSSIYKMASKFAGGVHSRLVAGQSSVQHSRQTSRMIEEEKEFYRV